MRVFNNVETKVIIQETVGIICNKCGEVFTPSPSDGVQKFKVTFGEGSRFDSDWHLDICDNCVSDIVKTFKVVPDGFMSESQFYVSSFDLDHDLHQRLFDEWKETGEWNCDENPWTNEENTYED